MENSPNAQKSVVSEYKGTPSGKQPHNDNGNCNSNGEFNMGKFLQNVDFEKYLKNYGLPTVYLFVLTVFLAQVTQWTGREILIPMKDAHVRFVGEVSDTNEKQANTSEKTAEAMEALAETNDNIAETQKKILTIIDKQQEATLRRDSIEELRDIRDNPK